MQARGLEAVWEELFQRRKEDSSSAGESCSCYRSRKRSATKGCKTESSQMTGILDRDVGAHLPCYERKCG